VTPKPRDGWRRFRRKRGALAGLTILAALGFVAAAADLVASDLPLAARVDGRLYLLPCLARPAALLDEDNQTLAARAARSGGWSLSTPIPYGPLASRPGGRQEPLRSPSLRHLAGTDDRGRDVAARLIHGTRTALCLGALAVALYLAAGMLVGAACATSRAADLVLGRLIELGLGLPTFFLLLALQGVVAARVPSLIEVAVAIALTRWPEVARLVRAESLRLAAAPHVEAARALGASPSAIAWRHVLPLAAGPALTAAAFGVGQAVLVETGLTFLGLGVPPQVPSWGELLAQAQAAGLPWWLVVSPTAAIAVTVLACQRVADGVRAVLDPTAR
jgi:ABC-type dipeptide/oligopeptide/nickel transport system permease subunit